MLIASKVLNFQENRFIYFAASTAIATRGLWHLGGTFMLDFLIFVKIYHFTMCFVLQGLNENL